MVAALQEVAALGSVGWVLGWVRYKAGELEGLVRRERGKGCCGLDLGKRTNWKRW